MRIRRSGGVGGGGGYIIEGVEGDMRLFNAASALISFPFTFFLNSKLPTEKVS
jgi:hypothetical protein